MDLQWNSDAFLQPQENSENKHYYISSLKKTKEKLLADFLRKLELCADNNLWGPAVGSKKLAVLPSDPRQGKSDQAFPGPIELMAADLKQNVPETGEGLNIHLQLFGSKPQNVKLFFR